MNISLTSSQEDRLWSVSFLSDHGIFPLFTWELDSATLTSLSLTCTSIRDTCSRYARSNAFWSLRLQALLGLPHLEPTSSNWKNVYISFSKCLIMCPQMEILVQKDRRDRFFIAACCSGHVAVVRTLVEQLGTDPAQTSNSGLVSACTSGRTEVVKYLLSDSRVDPSDRNNLALRRAAAHSRLSVIELLLADRRVDPTTSRYEIFFDSCSLWSP